MGVAKVYLQLGYLDEQVIKPIATIVGIEVEQIAIEGIGRSPGHGLGDRSFPTHALDLWKTLPPPAPPHPGRS